MISLNPRTQIVDRFESCNGGRIYRIACDGLPSLGGYVHLLLNAGPPTLVDAGNGSPESLGQIIQGIRSVRDDFGESVSLHDIQRILITHGHVDHVGGLAELVNQTGAEVAIHRMDSRAVTAFDEYAVMNAKTLECFFCRAGAPPDMARRANQFFGHSPGRSHNVPIACHVVDGHELDGLRLIHTPGHSPGHVCMAVGDILLSGDHVLPTTVTQQWPGSMGSYHGLHHYLESLDKIPAGHFRLAIGGHEAAFENIEGRIKHLRETQHRRLSRVLDILRGARQPLTIWQVAIRMYGEARGIQAVMAVMDAGSRIEYLYERGYLNVANLETVGHDEHAAVCYRG